MKTKKIVFLIAIIILLYPQQMVTGSIKYCQMKLRIGVLKFDSPDSNNFLKNKGLDLAQKVLLDELKLKLPESDYDYVKINNENIGIEGTKNIITQEQAEKICKSNNLDYLVAGNISNFSKEDGKYDASLSFAIISKTDYKILQIKKITVDFKHNQPKSDRERFKLVIQPIINSFVNTFAKDYVNAIK